MKSLIALALNITFVVSNAMAATPPTNAKYGGACAWGLTTGQQVKTDCAISWTDTTTHATYCFSTEANKAEWAKNTAINIAKADAEFAKHNALNQANAAMNQAQQAVNQAMQQHQAATGTH